MPILLLTGLPHNVLTQIPSYTTQYSEYTTTLPRVYTVGTLVFDSECSDAIQSHHCIYDSRYHSPIALPYSPTSHLLTKNCSCIHEPRPFKPHPLGQWLGLHIKLHKNSCTYLCQLMWHRISHYIPDKGNLRQVASGSCSPPEGFLNPLQDLAVH